MSGVILRGKALKIVNKGGGRKCTTEKLGGGRRRIKLGDKQKGTDYIVFNCPGCGKRNKQSAYQCKGRAGNSLSFKCNGCLREIEVEAPIPVPALIIGANAPGVGSALLGPDGRPL